MRLHIASREQQHRLGQPRPVPQPDRRAVPRQIDLATSCRSCTRNATKRKTCTDCKLYSVGAIPVLIFPRRKRVLDIFFNWRRQQWSRRHCIEAILESSAATASHQGQWWQRAARFHGLQVLRVIAAVMIVAYHTGTLAGGVFGLDTPLVRFLTQPFFGSGVFLFFALSGFVIAHSLRSAPPGRFLLMRAARLYPGYWLAAGLTVAVFWIVWRIVPVISWKRFTFGLTLLPSTDPSRFVLYVEWSLVYEVLFYLVFGLLAFGGQRAIKVGGLFG